MNIKKLLMSLFSLSLACAVVNAMEEGNVSGKGEEEEQPSRVPSLKELTAEYITGHKEAVFGSKKAPQLTKEAEAAIKQKLITADIAWDFVSSIPLKSGYQISALNFKDLLMGVRFYSTTLRINKVGQLLLLGLRDNMIKSVFFIDTKPSATIVPITITGDVKQAEFTADGSKIVALADTGIFIWDIAKSKVIATLISPFGPATDVFFALSNDSKHLCIGHDNNIKIINVDTGQEIADLSRVNRTENVIKFMGIANKIGVMTLGYSTTGEAMLTVNIWDLSIGQVPELSFSMPYSTFIASGLQTILPKHPWVRSFFHELFDTIAQYPVEIRTTNNNLVIRDLISGKKYNIPYGNEFKNDNVLYACIGGPSNRFLVTVSNVIKGTFTGGYQIHICDISYMQAMLTYVDNVEQRPLPEVMLVVDIYNAKKNKGRAILTAEQTEIYRKLLQDYPALEKIFGQYVNISK